LNKHGANLTADGVMGPKTRAALKAFQKAHGLKANGWLDEATEKELGLAKA
jgi:peptidoglycan hydrolase-like protein with peptidoglycan-binding domain